MPETHQTSPRRQRTKGLVLCLLLGAVLQYLMAVLIMFFHADELECDFEQDRWLLAQLPPEGDSVRIVDVTLWTGSGARAIAMLPWGLDLLDAEFHRERSGWQTAMPASASSGDEGQLLDFAPPGERFPFWSRGSRLIQSGAVSLDTGYVVEFGFGWPSICATYLDVGGECRRGIEIPSSPSLWCSTPSPRAVPLGIIWPGALANTAVYAAPLLLIWCLLTRARANWRRRRGHCINCNYDLRGADHKVCPECGAAKMIG